MQGLSRSMFPTDAWEAERALVGPHFAFLQALLAEGRLILAGRTEGAEVDLAASRLTL